MAEGQGGRFNPLHCGAVVASRNNPNNRVPAAPVSIPFIAGQWSLQGAGRDRRRGGPRGFNPLHCGAVVASRWPPDPPPGGVRVSIPFIAGQWSLRSQRVPRQRSPEVSIPFIAGQWSLPRAQARAQREIEAVSIPFIAGQWSLLEVMLIAALAALVFQSPSLRGSGRFARRTTASGAGAPCFNPLHCGAVVASSCFDRVGRRLRRVSIPFIAGQWSLPKALI